MLNLKFLKTNDTDLINAFRKELYKTFFAPLDSLWLDLYIASSQAFLIEHNEKQIGYCCIDENNALLQLYTNNENKILTRTVIENLVEANLITSASLSCIEPISFNNCLQLSKSLKTNTFCYEISENKIITEDVLNIELVSKSDSEKLRNFYKNHIGFEDTFGYIDNLVARKELFMFKNENTVIATGECRLSDTQLAYADVGVAVNKEHRKKGFATKILQQLAKESINKNRKPICSTTIENIGSQKAIESAGFYCSNIIFDMNFNN